MKIRLTRKFAEQIDGIDLEGYAPGDLMELPPEQARIIVAEEWAVPERREHKVPDSPRRRAADYMPNEEAAS